MHILNRCPTVAVQNKTPEEAWSGVKPTIGYFRVFGCVAHAHVPDQKRSKLDDKSRKCVLLGVSDESKAYRLYDPVSKKIIVSKDVVFEEDECWNWDRSKEECKLDVLECKDDFENDIERVESNDEGDDAVANTRNSNESDSTSSESHEDEPLITNEGRVRKPPSWMEDFETGEGLSDEDGLDAMIMLTQDDPLTFEEAVKSKKWRDAMMAEIESIEKNKTWELTVLPQGVNPIGVKWVFKTKLKENGEIDKYKARLVAKGYAQQYGVDYT
jgi:hypothetical protein